MPKDRLFSLLKAATPTVDLGPSFAKSTKRGRPPEEAIEERSPNWSHQQIIALLSPPLPVKGSAKERFYGFLLRAENSPICYDFLGRRAATD